MPSDHDRITNFLAVQYRSPAGRGAGEHRSGGGGALGTLE